MTTMTPVPASTKSPWRVGSLIDEETFARIRRRMLLSCCKWDPQVGDVSTLAPFPIVLRRSVWEQLASWAEMLAAEACAAEREILEKPELFHKLAIPRCAAKSLRGQRTYGESEAGGRVIRFDFHWTTDGWQISEANADVPGGFTESSSFTEAVAHCDPSAEVAGNPALRWREMLENVAGVGGTVALLVAPGYMEDHQVVSYLADRLRKCRITAHVCQPHHLHWEQGRAYLESDFHRGPIDAVVRFYQAEWLASLKRSERTPDLFRPSGPTRVINPGSAMLIESKRFPIVWDQLKTDVRNWRALLPETRDPRHAPWRRSDDWILKAAFCNTGDEVAIRRAMPPAQWRKVSRQVWVNPRGWVAQKRFDPVLLDTPLGPMQVCLGVYTIDGKAVGIYGRMTPGAVVDYAAVDVAILVEKEQTL